jgi:hypothetical protein
MTVQNLYRFFRPTVYNKNEMLFVGKRITWERLDRFRYIFFNVRNSPNKVFRERKIGEVALKIGMGFLYELETNSGLERWICVILFLFASLLSWKSFQEKKFETITKEVRKFGQTAKIIIIMFVCTLDHNDEFDWFFLFRIFNWKKKSARFGEKFRKTNSSLN